MRWAKTIFFLRKMTKVPPPYVPRLSENIPVIPGLASNAGARGPADDTLNDPAAHDRQRSTDQARKWWTLNIREQILLGLLLLSAVLIPAALPPASIDARGFAPAISDLQPLEQAEENFAGSAFYFIDPGYAIPKNYAVSRSADDTPEAMAPFEDIRPVAFRASALDNGRALECLTSAIYYEAASESYAGQRAVAQVVLNRVRHPSYPATICGVVFQGSERRTGCQFSYSCDGSLHRTPSRFHWQRARTVAAAALSGKSPNPVGTATHYHTTEIYPHWAPSLRFLGTIGAHRFYSWKGNAGKAAAFHQRYRGGEPLPGPNPKQFNARIEPAADPVALAKAYEEGLRLARLEAVTKADTARRMGKPAPVFGLAGSPRYQTPDYSAQAAARGGEKAYGGQKLPDVSQIKPEYQNSGSWKNQPDS